MIKPPKVSVVLIVHNGARTLQTALSSLLLQTLQDWECVIVDDESDDGTSEILASLEDPRFKAFRAPRRLGRGGARRMALAHVSGEYIAVLDADDFYFPEKLKGQATILNAKPELTATVAGLCCFDESYRLLGVVAGYYPPGHRWIPAKPTHLRLPFVGIMFRRDKIGQLVYEDLPRGEDMHFFSALLAGRAIYVEANYTYGYLWRMNFEDTLLGLRQGVRTYRTKMTRYPVHASLLVAYTLSKILAYSLVERVGLWDLFVRWRFRKPSSELTQKFQSVISRLKPPGTEYVRQRSLPCGEQNSLRPIAPMPKTQANGD